MQKKEVKRYLVTGKYALGVQNGTGQRLTVLPRECIGYSKHSLPTTKEFEMQYLDTISKMIGRSLFVSKTNNQYHRNPSLCPKQ